MAREYVAFISYRHKPLDLAVAKQLHQRIERYRVPAAFRKEGRKSLGIVFRDQEELPVSANLSESIREALDHSEFLIVVCTPDTPESLWVNREIEYFLQHHDRDHVLAVLAAGTPETSFPGILTRLEDGSVVEPLAANICSDSVSGSLRLLRSESVRIFAAILGCPYDALVRREQRRHRRTRLLAASVVFCVLLGYGVIMLISNQRISAKNQELETANNTLTVQKQELVRSESLLLTEKAKYLREFGDSTDIVHNAAKALISPDGARPYYGPAEQILCSALHVFDADRKTPLLIDSRDIPLDNAALRIACSSDGETAYVLDQRSRLTAFSTASGEKRWQIDGDSNFHYERSTNYALQVNEKKNMILALYRDRLFSTELDTGNGLWLIGSVEQAAFSSDGIYAGVILHEQKSYDDTDAPWQLKLVDVENHAFVLTFTFPEEYKDIRFSKDAAEGCCSLSFSPGRSALCGVFSCTVEDVPKRCLWYARLDPEELHCLLLPETAESSPVWMTLLREKKSPAFCLAERIRGTDRIRMSEIDAVSGETIRQIEPVSPLVEGSSGAGKTFARITGKTLWIGCGSLLYAFRPETGTCLGVQQLSSEPCALFAAGEDTVGFVTGNGEYRLVKADKNDRLVSPDPLYRLGSCSLSIPGNGGFPFSSQTDAPADSSGAENGFMLTVPGDDSRTLAVRRIASYPLPETRVLCEVPEEVPVSTDSFLNLSGNEANLYFWEKGTDTLGHYWVCRFDLTGGKPSEVLSLPGTNACLLHDGKGVITYDFYGNLALVKDGETTQLASPPVPATEAEKQSIVLNALTCRVDLNEQVSSRQVLTAHCDWHTLRMWLDDEKQEPLPLPEDSCWILPANNINLIRCVGVNGQILLKSYDPELRGEQKRFLLFDLPTRQTVLLDNPCANDCIAALKTASSGFACMDEDNTVWIFDGTSKEPVSLKTGINGGDTSDLCFAGEDRFLIVCSADGYYEIYDTQTMTLCCAGQFDSVPSRPVVQGIPDREGERFWLIDTANHQAHCLSLRDWTCLGTLKNIYGFNPDENEAYFLNENILSASPIPTLEDLLQLTE